MIKLNLGSGGRPLSGYTSVDLYGPCDVRVDLSVFPWPWEAGSVDAVVTWDFLEHVVEFRKTWAEIHRILKPGGELWARVPNCRCPQNAWPEVHLHNFSIYTFKALTENMWFIEQPRFKTTMLRHWYGPKMRFLMLFANIHPLAWDWLGLPVSSVEWRGVKQ